MSLMKEVTALVAKYGPCTVDDILPMLPGHDRTRLRNALNNAKGFGYLTVTEFGRYPGNGGRAPAKYAVVGPEKPISTPAVNSVWNLGAA